MLISIGGNALAQGDEPYELQRERVERIIKEIKRYLPCIITHGNGTQVGNLLLQQERTPPKYPLFILTAMTQALIGEMIAEYVKKCVIVMTHVIVDPGDPEFKNPTKPIGPLYDKKVFPTMVQYENKWRRVVPSPKPLDVVEKEVIKRFYTAGYTVICGGGGGIPVVDGKGVDAVVDKDYTSALIARFVGVKEMMFITKVDYVYRNFGKDDQEPIKKLDLQEAKDLLPELPPGSMRPKVEAAIDFLTHGGKRVIICSLRNIGKGTVIVG